MASVFSISEEDLFEFESFCDSKYLDQNCQKYGFFKVKNVSCVLHDAYAVFCILTTNNILVPCVLFRSSLMHYVLDNVQQWKSFSNTLDYLLKRI